MRETQLTNGMTVWLTGLTAAGKSTLAESVYRELVSRGYRAELLDADDLRAHLSKGLGFCKEDRDENVRRIGFVAGLLARHGVISVVAAISPYRETRMEVRQRSERFIEVYVNAPLGVLEQRDIKDIYRRARTGEIHHVAGMDDPYEPPVAPEVECRTDRETTAESTTKVIAAIEQVIAQKPAENRNGHFSINEKHRANTLF